MPGQLVKLNKRSQYFCLGKNFCSPSQYQALDGVRTNNTCPPLAFILSQLFFITVRNESNLLPLAGGSLSMLAKNNQLPVTFFCRLVSVTNRSIIMSCLSKLTRPNSIGHLFGIANTPCRFGTFNFSKWAWSEKLSWSRKTNCDSSV